MRFPLYSKNTGRNLAARTAYYFKGDGGNLVGWVVAPHGTELKWEGGMMVLVMPSANVEADRLALTPHVARQRAQRGEIGLKWIDHQ